MSKYVKANPTDFLMFDMQKSIDTEHMIFSSDFILFWPQNCAYTLFFGSSHYFIKAGELALIAPFNPYRLELENHEEKNRPKELHFRLNSMGQTFVGSVQFRSIKKMLVKARSGILFDLGLDSEIYTFLKKLENTLEFSQVLNLLGLLDKLSHIEVTQNFLIEDFVIKNSQRIEDRVQIALKYIDENLGDHLSVSMVAEQLYMGESTFSRFFHENIGVTFRQYIIEQRIRQAARYLVVTDWSVSQIAAEVGFSSLSNFNSKFKVLLKYTPKEYRFSHLDMKSNIVGHRSIKGQLENQMLE